MNRGGLFYTGTRYQRGNGLFYSGARYQKGNGFFSRVIKSAVWPLMKYIGKQGFKTAVAIGEEAARNPEHFKEIAKEKLREAGLQAVDDGAQRVKKFIQTGSGVKRKAKKIVKGGKRRKISKRKYSWL